LKASHAFEAALARALAAGVRALPWPASLAFGAGLGDFLGRLGLRRRVAEENLAHAFPERSAVERRSILREHYRELGRVAAEYARLGALARAAEGEVVAEIFGFEHLEWALARGRGAILLSGHFGNFELLGAHLTRYHPVDYVVRSMSNPHVERLIARERERAGVGRIRAETGARRVYQALRENRWVAMLADQDGGRHGVLVPFLGRPASTPLGPARIAIATGAPIVAGFAARRPDGRHTLVIEPPLVADDPRAADAAERLTARHVALLERWVRRRPESWLWLHRRWKTAPAAGMSAVPD